MAEKREITISRNVIARLAKYKTVLRRLSNIGMVRIISGNLGDAVGVTSAQVRKDFWVSGVSGNKKGGYVIQECLEKLTRILGNQEITKVVLAGVGHLGRALLNYRGFEHECIRIVAGFDSDPLKTDRAGAPPVLPSEELAEFIKKENIKIGIIAAPEASAQKVLDQMEEAGIEGVMNFAPITLRSRTGSVIQHIHLCTELETIIYFVNAVKRQRTHENL